MDQELFKQYLGLHHAKGIGPISYFKLIEYFKDDIQELFKLSSQTLSQTGLSDLQIAGLKQINWNQVDAEIEWASKPGNQIISLFGDHYPNLLTEIPDPPPILYLAGDETLLQTPQIGIVGSRTATPSGLDLALQFASYLSQSGLTITSGMALGIDTSAHRGALKQSGKTIAVTGTGLDRVYPSKNKQLAHDIYEKGLLISEFPLTTPPTKGNFPKRNRIISGLSTGVLVVEATEKIGSLITAEKALEQGREVFAIPGSIHNPHAKGCHQLIKNGAKLVEKAEDIIEELPSLLGYLSNQNHSQPYSKKHEDDLDPEYQVLLDKMGYEPICADDIAVRSGLTIDKVSSMLLILELNDYIKMHPGGLYIRTSTRPS